MKCASCGREVFGFWKYVPDKSKPACSMSCFRAMVFTGEIPTLLPNREIKELGILPPINAIIEK